MRAARNHAADPRTYSHLHENIQDKFRESAVDILSPHFRVNRGDDQVAEGSAGPPDRPDSDSLPAT